MILLCDEDIGTGVPKALTSVGYDARSLTGMSWGGQPDQFWLTKAGQLKFLVLSCNKKMRRWLLRETLSSVNGWSRIPDYWRRASSNGSLEVAKEVDRPREALNNSL